MRLLRAAALGLPGARYTPVFVFLDASGKKVVDTRGFRNPREARALHEFVSKRHYLKTVVVKVPGSLPRRLTP